jgi:hypothetical protein
MYLDCLVLDVLPKYKLRLLPCASALNMSVLQPVSLLGMATCYQFVLCEDMLFGMVTNGTVLTVPCLRWLVPSHFSRSPGFDPSPGHVKFVVDRVGLLGWVSLQYFGSSSKPSLPSPHHCCCTIAPYSSSSYKMAKQTKSGNLWTKQCPSSRHCRTLYTEVLSCWKCIACFCEVCVSKEAVCINECVYCYMWAEAEDTVKHWVYTTT